MVVVGAGLAGLSAAVHLTRHGRRVLVLESADQAGGRVRTDLVDGYRLDRGFQVFNTAYPEPARLLDLTALQLRCLVPGALVYAGGRRHRLVDPRRRPASAPATVTAPVGTLADKARLGALAARDALAPAGWLKGGGDRTTEQALRRFGLSGRLVEQFLRPFLAGVFLERELSTSARFFHLVWRSFARGRICLPANGMGAIPAQLAALLDPAALRLRQTVQAVQPHHVTLTGGERLAARAVVVATDPATAVRLLPGLPEVPMRGVTTVYHRADESPLGEPILVLDGQQHLIANTAVLTDAAPSYGPGTGALVSTSVLGGVHGADLEPAVRARLATLYGTGTSSWEHLATCRVPAALPAMPPPHPLRRPVRLVPGLYVCGDHRDTSSIQGAMVSGRRAAAAVLADLGDPAPGADRSAAEVEDR